MGLCDALEGWLSGVMSLCETIRSLRVGEVDGVIESAGGWAMK